MRNPARLTGILTQARHWLQNAFDARLASRTGIHAHEVEESRTALVNALDRSAAESMAQNANWNVAKRFYLQAAKICQQVVVGNSTATTSNTKANGRATNAAKYLWHAAVVASWQLDYEGAWKLFRQGVEVVVPNPDALKRVADAEVIMLIPDSPRTQQVLGRTAGEWGRELHEKFVEARSHSSSVLR